MNIQSKIFGNNKMEKNLKSKECFNIFISILHKHYS